MNKDTQYLIDEILAKAKDKKNNGPITISADSLWKYSGKVEETNIDYVKYQEEVIKIKNYSTQFNKLRKW